MDSVLWLEIPRSDRTTIECNVMLLVSCALDILHIYKLLAHYGISLLSSPPIRRRLSYCPKSLNVDIYPQHSCSLLLGSHVSSSFSCSSCTSFLLPRVLVPYPFAFLCMSHSLNNLTTCSSFFAFLIINSTSITNHFATLLHLFTPTYTHIWIHRRNPLRARAPPFFLPVPHPHPTLSRTRTFLDNGYCHWIAPLAERFRLFLVIHAMCNVVILILLCLFCPQFGKPAFFVLRLPVHYDHPSMGPPTVAVCEHTLDSPGSRPV